MSQIIINGQPLYQVDLPEMTLAQWLALPVAERPKEWIRTDAEYTDIPAENIQHTSVSVTADGVKTFGGLLTDLYSAMDTAKITHNSKIVFDYGGGKEVFFPMVLTSAVLIFTNITQNDVTINIQLRSGGASVFSDTGYSTSSVATSGFKITLYYD